MYKKVITEQSGSQKKMNNTRHRKLGVVTSFSRRFIEPNSFPVVTVKAQKVANGMY
jgi:hypothetical protein